MTLIINGDGEIHPDWITTPSGLILSEDVARLRYAPKKHPQGGDLFAGCGGASLGFKQAGIQVRFAVELWTTAAITYMCNLGTYPCTLHFETAKLRAQFEKEIVRKDERGLYHVLRSGSSGVMQGLSVPGTDHMWMWDVRNLTGKMLLDPIGMKPGDLDVLHGSPPCQGVSTAGKKSPHDPRNFLMLEYARLITEIRPTSFTMEQVPNVLNMTMPDGQPIMDAFFECIERGGYATRKALSKMIELQGGSEMLLRKGGRTAKSAEGRAAKSKGVRDTTPPGADNKNGGGEIGSILGRLRQSQSIEVRL